MRCEICGKNIIGNPVKTKIESTLMNTCKECSKFGKIQKEPPKPRISSRRASNQPRRVYKSSKPTYEVVEDYSKVIREGREKKGWSREELGAKINEKVSVVNRLESGRMVPDLKLARKIERILKVILLEKTDDTALEDMGDKDVRGATIGDIARIKKN
jgi:putative transcription factor